MLYVEHRVLFLISNTRWQHWGCDFKNTDLQTYLLCVISVFGHTEDHGLQPVGGHPWCGPGRTGRDGRGGRGRGGRLRERRHGRRGVNWFLRHASRQPWKPSELRRILRTRGVWPFRGCLRNQKPWRWGNLWPLPVSDADFCLSHSGKKRNLLSLLQVL